MTEAEKIFDAMEKMKEWITVALNSSNYKADYSVESMKEIDRFFDEQSGDDGLISKNPPFILFALGVYVGETVISNFGGSWDLSNAKDEKEIKVVVDEDTVLFPLIRILARYQIGSANSLYAYVNRLYKRKEKTAAKKQNEITVDSIFEIKDKSDFIIKMSVYISKKCENGKKLEALNNEERIFYVTQTLEAEVNSGGFSGFFFNSDGCLGNELVYAFEQIGAARTAEICKKAIGVFGAAFPEDREERQGIMENDEERIEKTLGECDEEFYEYEDDLSELNYSFVINNKEKFVK